MQARAQACAGYTLPAEDENAVGSFSTEDARIELLSPRTEGRQKRPRRKIGENAHCAGEITGRKAMDSIHASEIAYDQAVRQPFSLEQGPGGTECDIGNNFVLVTLHTAKMSKTIGGTLAGERLERPVLRVHARSECVQNKVLGSLSEVMTQGNDGDSDLDFELEFVYRRDGQSFVNTTQARHREWRQSRAVLANTAGKSQVTHKPSRLGGESVVASRASSAVLGAACGRREVSPQNQFKRSFHKT